MIWSGVLRYSISVLRLAITSPLSHIRMWLDRNQINLTPQRTNQDYKLIRSYSVSTVDSFKRSSLSACSYLDMSQLNHSGSSLRFHYELVSPSLFSQQSSSRFISQVSSFNEYYSFTMSAYQFPVSQFNRLLQLSIIVSLIKTLLLVFIIY